MHSDHSRMDSCSTCVVCCEDIQYFAIGQCDHPICHVCSVRMRVLGKENYCAVCRTDLDQVILTKKSVKWSSIQDQLANGYLDKKLGLCYTNKDVRTKVKELLEHKCSICPDRPPDKHFDKLREHMKKEHELLYCGICVQHHSKFSHEWKLYNRSQLATHRRLGDSDDTSHKGHPICKFCEDRFLDDDELHRHLRKNHFWCHICEKDGKQLYYEDYINLRKHYKDDHFLCEEDMCKYEQFTSVFRTDVDFQLHRASKHSEKMTKAQVRQARQLEVDLVYYTQRPGSQGRTITGRDYDEVRVTDQRSKRSKGHGKGSGNSNRQEEVNMQTAIDNSLETPQEARTPSPPNTITEKTKDESVQLQLDHNDFPSLSGTTGNLHISQHSSPGVSPKVTKKTGRKIDSLEDFPSLGSNAQPRRLPPPGFGNLMKETLNLSKHKPPPPGINIKKQSPPIRKKSEPPPTETIKSKEPDVIRKDGGISNKNPKVAPKKEVQLVHKNTVSRNQAFIDHVKQLLGHDLDKFAEFKTLSGKFRQGHCTAKHYYLDCTALFGSNFAFIFNELVSLLPDPEKQQELLNVHSDSKAQAKQNGKTTKESNGIKQPSPQIAWGPPPVNQAKPVKPAKPVQVKHDPKARHEIDFPSLPPAGPRQMKAIHMYRPTTTQPMKSAWVRGK